MESGIIANLTFHNDAEKRDICTTALNRVLPEGLTTVNYVLMKLLSKYSGQLDTFLASNKSSNAEQ